MMEPKTVIGKKNISEHVTKLLPHTYITMEKPAHTSIFSQWKGRKDALGYTASTNICGYSIRRVIVPTATGGSLPITLGQNENFCLPQAVVNPEGLVKRLLIG